MSSVQDPETNPENNKVSEPKRLLSARIIAGSIMVSGALIALAIAFGSVTILAHLNKLNDNIQQNIQDNIKSVVQQSQSGKVLSASQAANQTVVGLTAPTSVPRPVVDIVLKPGVPIQGNAQAKVVVVEFADFQCPFCRKFYETVYPQLKANYIDTGKIKFVYQTFALLGQESADAGAAALCAQDQGKFWQYHDFLFQHQQAENSGAFSVKNLESFAKSLSLNTDAFAKCLDSGKHTQDIAGQTAAGTHYGVTGTPSIFINGEIIAGAEPYTVFAAAIDAALKK